MKTAKRLTETSTLKGKTTQLRHLSTFNKLGALFFQCRIDTKSIHTQTLSITF
jgi:hypothetical protein